MVCKYPLGAVARMAGWHLSGDRAVASRLLQEIGFAAIYLCRAPRQPVPVPWGCWRLRLPWAAATHRGLPAGLRAALLLLGVLNHPDLRLKWCWEACRGKNFGFSSSSLCFGQWWLLHRALPPASAQRLLAPLQRRV